ncbi:4'-phosphopantetheinyl transferase family protein [Streptomyces atratus]|uniref:4'-phosphopantetheinyl transferase family protein n=1 Tax=Streptomyces atratus TaxID=1893 RepID=UPI0016700671|nr:4'-phosphopantetheinyl transferase family protein [Streptomyces atratus]
MTVLWGPTAGDARTAAHTALLRGAALLTGEPADAFRLTYEPGGRPRLAGAAAPPHVSISHGRGVWAVALGTTGPVGVDVEAVRPVPALRMAGRWLDAAAADWLARVPPAARPAAFLWLWTQKEAIGKARGRGLRGGGLGRPVPVPERWPPTPARGGLPALRPLADDPGIFCAALLADSGRHVLALASAAPTTVELRGRFGPGGADPADLRRGRGQAPEGRPRHAR